jgi:hypothetical protein
MFSQKGSAFPTSADLDVLIPAMLVYIGSADSELRDDLIYSTFAAWITDGKTIPTQQCSQILQVVLDDDHLFFKIGDMGTDSVFTRTFSVLLIPPILIRHRNLPFLNEINVKRTKESLLRYVREEKDRRGYVEGPGWAHAIAHSADALDDLAQCVELGENDLREILDALKEMILSNDFTYAFGEDERMVTPVIAVIRRGFLPQADMATWVNELGETALAERSMPARLVKRSNARNFLTSLYFRLKWVNVSPSLLPVIEKVLEKLNPYKGA